MIRTEPAPSGEPERAGATAAPDAPPETTAIVTAK